MKTVLETSARILTLADATTRQKTAFGSAGVPELDKETDLPMWVLEVQILTDLDRATNKHKSTETANLTILSETEPKLEELTFYSVGDGIRLFPWVEFKGMDGKGQPRTKVNWSVKVALADLVPADRVASASSMPAAPKLNKPAN